MAKNGFKLPDMEPAEVIDILKAVTTIQHSAVDRLAGIGCEVKREGAAEVPDTGSLALG